MTATQEKIARLNPAETVRKTFDEGRKSMQKGRTGTLDQVPNCLAKT